VSMFSPKGILGVIGVVLALIALYLILEHATGATSILGSLAGGSLATIGVLQGRNVSGGGYSISTAAA
jgi:hypothetical protein